MSHSYQEVRVGAEYAKTNHNAPEAATRASYYVVSSDELGLSFAFVIIMARSPARWFEFVALYSDFLFLDRPCFVI